MAAVERHYAEEGLEIGQQASAPPIAPSFAGSPGKARLLGPEILITHTDSSPASCGDGICSTVAMAGIVNDDELRPTGCGHDFILL